MSANKNIIELIKDCNYQSSYKDYIMKILIELSSHKNAVFFKTVLPHSHHKIIAIKYPLNIKLKGNSYEIKLTIYLPADFPEKSPELFIDNNGDPLLAANPKNHNVNPENFRVMTSKLFNWAKFTSIQEILTEVINSFEMNFPIYKKKPNSNTGNSSNQSNQSNSNSNSINMNNNNNSMSNTSGFNNNSSSQNSNNSFYPNNNNNNMWNNNNNNKGCPPPIGTNNNFNINKNNNNSFYPNNNNNNQNFNNNNTFYPNNNNNNYGNNSNSSTQNKNSKF